MSCENEDFGNMPRYRFKVHFWFHMINEALVSEEKKTKPSVGDPDVGRLRLLSRVYRERFDSSLSTEYKDDIARGNNAYYRREALKEALKEVLGEQG